jgi:hypothetical protein
MAQVVECLPSKCKALSSNSSMAKKKVTSKLQSTQYGALFLRLLCIIYC